MVNIVKKRRVTIQVKRDLVEEAEKFNINIEEATSVFLVKLKRSFS